MKKFIFLIIIFNSQTFFGQNKKILSAASVGLIITDINETGLSNTGFATSTVIEYNLSKKLWLTGSLEFQTINFLKTTSNYTIQDKISITPIKLGLRYLLVDKKFSPYILSNIGLARLTSPTAENNGAVIKIGKTNEKLFVFDGGFGLEWKFKPAFFPFFEANYNHFIGTTDISESRFNQLTFRIGTRTFPF